METINFASTRIIRKLSCLLTILVFILFSGCTGNEDDQRYKSDPISYKENGVKIKTSLKAGMKKGELTLYMEVKNTSQKNIHVDYLFCNLSVDAERVVLAEPKKSFREKLAPGDIENYEIVFRPINSLELFNNMGYRGDLQQKYTLKTNFIKDEEGRQLLEKTIAFEMPDNAYRNYIDTYGLNDKIKLYDLSFDRDSFISEQTEYLKKIASVNNKSAEKAIDTPLENVVLISDLDIILDSRAIKLSGYKQNDTLFMNIGITNMGKNRLKVLLNKICVNVSGRNYFPSTIQSEYFSYNQFADSTLVLKQGARFFFLLKYTIPENIDLYKLNTEWLLVQSKNIQSGEEDYIRLVKKDLLFNESVVPKNN